MIQVLYAINGIVATLLYLPQIMRIWKDRGNSGSLSLVTFGGWSIGSLITALYAWTVVKDPMFTTISLGNMTGSGTIFVLIMFKPISVLPICMARNALRYGFH